MKRHDQSNIETMEMVWGGGYMSPGGDVEVARIVAGLDLRGQRVPGLSCGLGGAIVVRASTRIGFRAPRRAPGAHLEGPKRVASGARP